MCERVSVYRNACYSSTASVCVPNYCILCTAVPACTIGCGLTEMTIDTNKIQLKVSVLKGQFITG